MGLKFAGICIDNNFSCLVLIEPLWDWNLITDPSSPLYPNSFNRTIVGLKFLHRNISKPIISVFIKQEKTGKNKRIVTGTGKEKTRERTTRAAETGGRAEVAGRDSRTGRESRAGEWNRTWYWQGKKSGVERFYWERERWNRILFTELQKCEKNLLRKGKGNFILSGLTPNCLPQEGNL